MAKAKTTTKKTTKKAPEAQDLINYYMNDVLENEHTPKSVYKFAKDNGFKEQEFYAHFGSFDALRKSIWNQFYANTEELLHKSKEYEQFTNREKLLTFYYTMFELLTANRSYVLYALKGSTKNMGNLEQLKGLRKRIKNFAKDIIQDKNDTKSIKLFEKSEVIFSEAVWIQFLFLLKFWMDDNSAAFESTDVAIEKSVNTAFDVFDTAPLERLVDFGKFLWKERMA